MAILVRRTTNLILIASLSILSGGSAVSQTLKEALAEKHLNGGAEKLANGDKKITSGAELDDANQFVIAYYLDDGTGDLNPPLFIDRYDRKGQEWKSVALPDAQSQSANLDEPCLGSILDIKSSAGRMFLETHNNPSAGCLLVLSPDLKLEVSLYGWLLGQLGTDMLVYHRSQVHFAPVHPAEIAVYDLRSKHDVTIFPPKVPSAIRRARTAQLREFYKLNQAWCSKNDDPCDPESFDSALQGPVATDEAAAALAFLVSYEQIQYAPGDVQKPSGPKDVLYVFRRVDDQPKMEFREMPWDEAKRRFGEIPLQGLLDPGVLAKIFSESLAKKP